MAIRKRNLVKERANTGSNARVANRRRKGVSTIIGITIFLLIFAIAVSYTFAWTQNTGSYLQTVNQQVDLDRLKLGENLMVTALNTTAVTVTNPTGNVIIVDQIWSGGLPVWSGQQGISNNYGNCTFNNATSGNGQFTVVTTRGNIFSGGLQSQLAAATRRSWGIYWYYNGSTTNLPPMPANLSSSFSSFVGQSYYYDLNLAWSWTAFNNPVIGGNYNISSDTLFGFVANTTLMKLSDSPATINYHVDNNPFSNNSVVISFVPYGQNATIPSSWDNSTQLILQYGADSNYTVIPGPQYSLYTVTIYFYTFNDTNVQLSLNIVNATIASFAP